MDEKTRKTLAEEAQALQHKAGKTKTKYNTLHRGMVLSVEDARSMFTPNSTYTFDTLTATATDKGIASIYTNVENMVIENGVPVMIEIQKPDGIYGFDRDGMEVLLPKGSEFKVTRNWMDKDGVVHVSMYSKKGNNVLKSDDIPFIDSKKANLAKASDDWFEYENAQFMREAVRTGTVPVVTPDGSILPDGGDGNGGGGSDKKSKTADAALARLEKKIHKVYDVASKEVQAKLDDYMRRFKIKDEIKRKALKKGLITEAEYKQWRTGQIMIGKRWEEMQTVLAQDLTNANRIAASMINGHTPDAYAIGSNYATFEVEAGSMLNTSFTLYDRHTVERLVKENPKLLPKARVDIPKDLRWNKQKLNSAITQGVLQGEDLNKVSRRLRSVTDMDRSSAIRNARTMMTSAENGGRFNSYLRAEDLGINIEKQWLATLDGRTRHSHAAQDGEHVPIKEEFSNGLMYPADPDGDPREVYNCRCTMVAVVGETDPSVSPSDVYRDSRLGDMDYEDWIEEHMEAM